MPPFTEPTDAVSAVITDAGRSLIAQSVLGTVHFQLYGFSVGRSGYDSVNPVKVVPVNSSDTGLTDPIYPTTDNPPLGSVIPFVTLEQPFPNVVSAVCRLSYSECSYGLGELGIWSRVIHPTEPPTYDPPELFALTHFPILSKTNSHTFVFRVIIAL